MNLSGLPALAEAARRRVAIERRALNELKKLRPPADVATVYRKMIAHNEVGLEDVEKLAERARAGDAAGARAAKDEVETASFRVLVAAVNARLKYCATTE